MSRAPVPISLLLAVVLAAPVRAQTATATGLITEQGRPIVGAPVSVDNRVPVLTNQDGRYSARVSAGQHRFTVALSGYRNNTQVVTLERNKTTFVNFALDPVLQIAWLTVPASLKPGTAGAARLLLRNTAPSPYSLDQVALNLRGPDGEDLRSEFTIVPDAANATMVPPGETVTLTYTLNPVLTAVPGKVTVSASLLSFNADLGSNLLRNPSFEKGTLPWSFCIDSSSTKATGANVRDPAAITGSYCVGVFVTRAGDTRAYWDTPVQILADQSYVLSGYVKTNQVRSSTGTGASVYVPVSENNPYQEPDSPWITGTRDWRRAIVAFRTRKGSQIPTAHCRGQIQTGTGTAWFDNFSLTRGTVDGSLTVTGGDATLVVGETTAPTISANPASGLDFGTVAVGGNSGVETIMLTAGGMEVLAISGVSLTGDDADQFSLVSDTGGVGFSPGGQRIIGVRFQPTLAGSKLAFLTVNSNALGGTLNIPLRGTAR